MSPRSLIPVLCLALLVPVVTRAQVCNGTASFSRRHVQFFGSGAFNSATQTMDGGVGFGGTGPFGNVGVGLVHFDNLDAFATLLHAGAGLEIPLGNSHIAYLCPSASIAHSYGPNDVDYYGDGSVILDLDETDAAFGLGVGVIVSRPGKTQVIPTWSIAFVNAKLTQNNTLARTTTSDTDGFGLMTVGVGFVFSGGFSLVPTVAVPLGLSGGVVTWSVFMSVGP